MPRIIHATEYPAPHCQKAHWKPNSTIRLGCKKGIRTDFMKEQTASYIRMLLQTSSVFRRSLCCGMSQDNRHLRICQQWWSPEYKALIDWTQELVCFFTQKCDQKRPFRPFHSQSELPIPSQIDGRRAVHIVRWRSSSVPEGLVKVRHSQAGMIRIISHFNEKRKDIIGVVMWETRPHLTCWLTVFRNGSVSGIRYSIETLQPRTIRLHRR